MDFEQRIGEIAATEPPDACWPWPGACGPDGYGATTYRGSVRRTHILAYELLVGAVPEGLQLDHLCRYRRCMNPGHLEPVTHAVNCLRGVGAPAVNATKTHCPEGHPLSGENLYLTPGWGYRQCRICRLRRSAEQHARKRKS